MTYARSISTILALLAISALLVAVPAGAAEAKLTAYIGCGQGEGLVRNDRDVWNPCRAEHAAVSTNAFQGEGLLASGYDIEMSRPFLIASIATAPHTIDPDCWKGEGYRGNPDRDENPCAEPLVITAYYVCEAGEGLRDPAAGPNPCRETAANR